MLFPRLCSKLLMEQEIEASSPEFLLGTRCVFPLTKPQVLCLLVKPYMHEPKPLLVYCRLLWTGLRMDKDFLLQYFVLLRELAAVPAYVDVLTVYVWMCTCVFAEGVEEYLLKM